MVHAARAGRPASPDPAVTAVRRAVAVALADVPEGAGVLVACSGGPDSLALAAGLAFVADPGRTAPGARRLRTGAVVVDHGWVPDSADVAVRAADACRALGLGEGSPDAVRIRRARDVALAGVRQGPEGDARAARYALLEEEADRAGAAVVLLGHTLDDQAETVLLGLARGSGTRALAGMAGARGRLRRPLLGLTRTTTRAACAALGLQVWDDPANADPAYARARVRAGLAAWRVDLAAALDRTPQALDAALARTAALAREDADALDALAASLLAEATLERSPAGIVLAVAVLAPAAPALAHRALLAAVRDVSASPADVAREHVLACAALVTPGARGGARLRLPGAVEAVRGSGGAYGSLTLRRVGGPAGGPQQRRALSRE